MEFEPWPEPALVIFMDFLIIISRKPSCLDGCSFFHCLLFQIFNDFEGEVHYIPSLGVLFFNIIYYLASGGSLIFVFKRCHYVIDNLICQMRILKLIF